MEGIIKYVENRPGALVTRRGARVVIYNECADPNKDIHGAIETPDGLALHKWDWKGVSSLSDLNNLTDYDVSYHFNWGLLPSWANAYLFKEGEDWYCSSMRPKRGKILWAPNKNSATYLLPKSVSDDILWYGHPQDSLAMNPAYYGKDLS